MVTVHFILKHSKMGEPQALNKAKAKQVKAAACLQMAGVCSNKLINQNRRHYKSALIAYN